MSLLDELTRIVRLANAEVLAVYKSAFAVSRKADQTPVTLADQRANEVIEAELRKLDSSVPILSEESDALEVEQLVNASAVWIVDPLDGTKEFVARRPEFTVNIGLVKDGKPSCGVVSWPLEDVVYTGDVEANHALVCTHGSTMAIQTRTIRQDALTVLTSRRRYSSETAKLVHSLRERFAHFEHIQMASSLKICRVAEGRADFYPQLGPTSEWDTAAAHAVLAAAGGRLLRIDGAELDYCKPSTTLNPLFFATGDASPKWLQDIVMLLSGL